jgi:two-component system, LytTR family, sensor kinase
MRSPWPVPIGRLLAVSTAYALAAALLSWGFTLTTGLSRWTMTPAGPARSYGNLLVVNLATWGSWALLAVLVFALGRRVSFGRTVWWRAVAFHGAASVAVAGGHGIIVSTTRVGLQTLLGLEPAWWPAVVENFFRTIDLHVPIYWALLGLQHAVDYHREVREREVAAARLETRLLEAQLQALHRQVHPHFLFNTLHAISAMLHREPDKADVMIERLGDMLRVTLASTGTQEVLLRQELDFLRAYLDIEQVNFGTRLRVSMAIDPDVLDSQVPYLVLQPLVENALRHGLAPMPGGGSLAVSARADGTALVLTVRDDGRGVTTAPVAPGHGVGVANTRARLVALHPGATLDIHPDAGGGTCVTVRLPLRLNAAAAPRERRAS